jgi:hypothetical protein
LQEALALVDARLFDHWVVFNAILPSCFLPCNNKVIDMDTNTALVWIVVPLIVVIGMVVVFLRFRQRGQARVQGPGGTSLEISGSNDPLPPTPGVRAEGVTSKAGGVEALDQTGRGVDVKQIEAHGDVRLTNAPAGGDRTPKT